MKRIALIMTFVVAAAMLCGCEDEYHSYLPDSHWILHADGMVEGHRLSLTFDGDQVEAADGNHKTPPFTSNRTWNYYITDANEMHIWYLDSDSDGGTSTTSYTLDYMMADDGLSLTLVYYPTFGTAKKYRFDKR